MTDTHRTKEQHSETVVGIEWSSHRVRARQMSD